MQLIVYFLNKKLHCITLTINGVEYCTADNRPTMGDESEVCICTSKTYAKGGKFDLDENIDELIEAGLVKTRVIEVEPIETGWKEEYGISYTLVKHPKLIF